jgi:hypothetical protein
MPEANDESVRSRIIKLAFGGDASKFEAFIRMLREVLRDDCQVILRGSAVTGHRWADGQPFDADGPGTSDLDVTFISPGMLDCWEVFYIPGLHSVPLNDEHPDACPSLLGLRSRLSHLAGRPVNLQASRSLVQFARDVLFEQPYYTLIEKADEQDRATPAA